MSDIELLQALHESLRRQFRGASLGFGSGFKADDAAAALARAIKSLSQNAN